MRVERLVRAAVAGLLALALPLLARGVAPAQPSAVTLAACMACHGPQGNSQVAQVPSLAGQPRIFIETQLVLVREGLREVPVMKDVMTGMTDEEIVALASYFAAQPALPIARPVDPEKARRGAQTSRRVLCGSCHLPDYSGQQQVPRLAGQHEAYLLQAMKQLRDRPGPGRDTIMAATLLGLKDGDLADLAHYLATFKR